MKQVILLHPRATAYHLGQVPAWLDESDPRPAREQINEKYRFGGWSDFKGTTLGKGNAMCYPGDPPQLPIAEICFRKERLFAYQNEFWAIKEADGNVTFARLD